MRGFVYNLTYIVNKNILSRVKKNSGIHNVSTFENSVMNAAGQQQTAARQLSL
jgi:hypothetical protein